jgi:hypothetical protein
LNTHDYVRAVIREDYILRLIKQLVDFLARIAGYNRKGEYQRALDEVGRAWIELFGVPRELVDVMDTPALAELLRDPEKMRAASQLLIEEARSLTGKGDPLHASVLQRRAMELRLEARAIDPSDADEAAILELSRLAPATQLAARYRR